MLKKLFCLRGQTTGLSPFLLLALALQILPASATEQPNVVIILADDMGWRDVSYHGSEIMTPRLDALAAGGLELDRFYAQPSCSPTRAALMTGRSAIRLGMLSPLSKLNPGGLPLGERLLPEYFKDAGYQTLMAGKWHLGFRQPGYLPTNRGFDHFYGHVTGGIGYWNHVQGGGLDWQRNGTTLREKGYSTHLLAEEAVKLIRNREVDRPMLLYASFNAPHLPNEAPPAAIAKYKHIADPYRRIHAAMVSELDTAIGRLIDTLEEEGILDNTLVWFMSDNGGLNPLAAAPAQVSVSRWLENWFGKPLPFTLLEFIRVNSLEGGASNLPLRKGKQSIYEGGARVPSLIYWKDRLNPRKVSQMLTVQDVLPTVLAAAGLTSNGVHFDGADHWPLISKRTATETPDYVIHGSDGEAIYRYPWKLLALGSGDPELYNIAEDPTERQDRADAYPELVGELTAALAVVPRGERVNLPLYRAMRDIDFFGGEEDREPWADMY